jgi:hypothetical protein
MNHCNLKRLNSFLPTLDDAGAAAAAGYRAGPLRNSPQEAVLKYPLRANRAAGSSIADIAVGTSLFMWTPLFECSSRAPDWSNQAANFKLTLCWRNGVRAARLSQSPATGRSESKYTTMPTPMRGHPTIKNATNAKG